MGNDMIEHREFITKDGIDRGDIYFVKANPSKGYNFGFTIYVPKGCQLDTTLILEGINTGSVEPMSLSKSEEIAKSKMPGVKLGYDLRMPMIIPNIPRLPGYYTHSFGSAVYNNDISELINRNNELRKENEENNENKYVLSDSEILEVKDKCKDLFGQVANMVESAKKELKKIGITVDKKVIVDGYSASSKFSNLFTAHHTELVKACICGGNNGLGIQPDPSINGEQLNSPLGTADIPNFDKEAFCEIPQLYYIGTEDDNSSAKAIVDENGQLEPMYPDSYTKKEIDQINRLFGGMNVQNRFDYQQQRYDQCGVNARFVKLPGNHSTVHDYVDGKYFYEGLDESQKEQKRREFSMLKSDVDKLKEGFVIEILRKEKQKQEFEAKKVEKKAFDKPSIEDAKLGRDALKENIRTAQQKKQEHIELSKQNKQLVLTNNNQKSGFASLFLLALITGFVAGIGTMIIYLMIR